MATTINLDTSAVQKRLGQLATQSAELAKVAANDGATEVLRLSQFEVPHNVGTLQNSGHIEPESDGYPILGYNTAYAARLHEHPEYRFQKGRKGKYLEDPIKNNLQILLQIIGERMQTLF